MKSSIVLRTLFFCGLMTLGSAGTAPVSASETIQPGDLLKVDYSCRLKTGELVATTEAKTAESATPKAALFASQPSYAPVLIRAGKGLFCEEKAAEELLPLRGFESEIAVRLSEALVGKAAGKQEQVEVSSAEQADLPAEERIVNLGRLQNIPRTMRFSRELYRQKYPSEPKVGQAVDMYEEVEGRIAAVTDGEVEIRFKARPAEQLKSPYGRPTVREQGDQFVVEVDVAEGRLVRINNYVGRVTNVLPSQFSLDFGHPFGGESLLCAVKADRVAEEALKTAGGEAACPDQPKAAPAAGAAKITAKTEGKASSAGPLLESAAQENPQLAQEGDIIEVNYTATLDDGTVVHTTLSKVADDPKRKRIEGFAKPEVMAPATLLAGRPDGLPGMGLAVLGLRVGERKAMSISPENTYGFSDPRRMGRYKKTNLIDKQKSFSAKDFIGRFQEFPVAGRELEYNQYLKAVVTAVGDEKATLKLLPAGKRFSEPYGEVQVTDQGDKISVALTPKIGAPFMLEDQQGRIIADDPEMFTVDYNNPLAGQSLNVEIEVVSLVKASALRDKQIAWIEDHDDGLKTAKIEKKPAVLVLYASWCGYSQKLFEETIADPRIRQLRDDFIWVKIDSHTHREFKEAYQQESFPLTVVLSPEGEILKSLKGFQTADKLRNELKEVAVQKRQLAKN